MRLLWRPALRILSLLVLLALCWSCAELQERRMITPSASYAGMIFLAAAWAAFCLLDALVPPRKTP